MHPQRGGTMWYNRSLPGQASASTEGNSLMKQISIQIKDEQKVPLLVELLSSLTFVSALEVTDVNGEAQRPPQDQPKPYISSQHQAMRREEAAFAAMKPALLAQYPQQFVALFQQQVIDHDPDELALLARIEQTYPDKLVLIRQVLETPEAPLQVRSPRLVREA
jgi:hypothetical protein